MAAFSEDFLCEDDFDAVLAIFRSYCCGANGSLAVLQMEKIITNATCALQFS